ncbi:helix-turn-helix domain-containing protein [Saccharopolyspora pogona]|uniref:helix-turn-helix domain-containing protein n=1 Tax=Saccharopolyspora pogona TaxID=333966 RepID=UPI0016820240|nr:helix-turn-helix transcriptional regulator [Saccharopolyspora pogona]
MLRELRRGAGLTIKDAAEWLVMGESAVSKIEKAKIAIKATHVRALGQLYDIDAAKLDYLLKLVKESNERGWWTAYRDTVPEWFRQFVGLEADSLDLWNYEAEYVPGLLQTSDYVRELMKANRPDMNEDEIERQVRLRRERQERLDGGQPPRLHFYINESVIRRPAGDSATWRRQVEHLIESSKLDHVTLRIVPFSAGPHPAMSGSFVMMQFPEEDTPAFVYLENQRGAVYQEDPGDIDRYMVTVEVLERLSLSPDDSCGMLGDALKPL